MTEIILPIIIAFVAGVVLGIRLGDAPGRWVKRLRRPATPAETHPRPPEAEISTGGELPEKDEATPAPRCGDLGSDPAALPGPDRQLLERATAYICDNLGRADLSVEQLSSHLGISRVYLYKKISSATGRTPIEFIRVLRLRQGAELLSQGELGIGEVASKVGFNSPRIFSRYFREEYGVVPSDYRNSLPDPSERGG